MAAHYVVVLPWQRPDSQSKTTEYGVRIMNRTTISNHLILSLTGIFVHGTALLYVALVAVLISTSIPVLAQQTATDAGTTEQQDEDDEDDSVALERVMVTSQKRNDDIQDIPFSVAAKSGEELIRLGAHNIEDIARNVAGFSIQDLGPGQSQVTMRGVSSGQIVRDQPGVKEQVGIYLDESVISLSLFTPDLELIDIDRVEVLRGPQGTLFGSGSLSGTVRYITTQPILGLHEGEVSMEGNLAGDDDLGGSFKSILNVPVGDKAALRMTPYFTRRGGFIDAVQPDGSIDTDVNDGERYGARVALRVEPTAGLAITPRMVFQQVTADGFNRQDAFNILANPFTTTRPRVFLGEREQFTQLKEEFDDEFLLLDLNLEYQFGNKLTLTSVSSYTDREVVQVRDGTALTGSITGGTIGLGEEIFTLDAPLIDTTDIEVFTQEIRVSGDPEAPLRWVAGAFYSDIQRDYSQDLLVRGFEDLSGIPTVGILNPKDVLFFSRIPYDFEQLAFFAELTYALTDRLDITVGSRYFDFDESRELNFDGIFADQTIAQPGKTSSDGFSPRFMINYAATDMLNLNAQVSKGFRLGGINDPLNAPLCTPEDLVTFGGRPSFDDEELWNYEVGAKSSFWNGRGTFNVAAYWMDIDDLQATLTAGTCSSRIIFNVPNSRVRGFDFELALQPTRNINLSVAGTLVDAELRSTITSVGGDGIESVVEAIERGNRLPTTPRFEISAGANFNWNIGKGWEGFLNTSVQHVGSRFTQIGDQAEGFGVVNIATGLPNNIGDVDQATFVFDPKLPAYEIGNARLGFRNPEWEVAVFVNNVWDSNAKLALDQERGRLARVGFLVAQARTFGLTARRFFNF